MKGLFLSNLNRKEQAYESVKKGVRNDLTSHICWHVYGLINRSDKNYDEAIKCYANALRQDKDNFQIQRDMSLLQIQMRNYEGFAETCNQMLVAKSSQRMFWMSYAVANHLLKEYSLAENVIDTWMNSLKEQKVDFENGEIWLYKNMIIEESGELERALLNLEEIKDKIVDKTAWKLAKARMSLGLGMVEQAKTLYQELQTSNTENIEYLQQLAKTCNVDLSPNNDQDRQKVVDWLQTLSKTSPKSHLLQRLPLKYAPISTFETLADEWLKKQLHKGVPSTFVAMKTIYSAETIPIVERLILKYRKCLENGSFDESKGTEPPTAWLWTSAYLAQHYDYCGNTTEALKCIDEAMEHTPTLVELYMIKARILKHAGAYLEASNVMDQGREIDLQDRFVNSKCVKYLLRAKRIADAERVVCLFTKPDAKDPLSDLIEMQNIWYTTESASSFLPKNVGKAVEKCLAVDKIFNDVYEDQFDFHGYCMRKMTLRSYIQLLRFEDRLKSHPYYAKAAKLGARTLLEVFDTPERKKKLKDDEKKILEGDLLEKATQFVAPLVAFGDDAESQLLGVHLYSRKSKFSSKRD
jgi:tetratricopeptide (TPR) repeat protein